MSICCSLPFNSISIDPKGNLRPCCNSDQDGFKENINFINVDQIINNSSITNLRQSFLKEIKDPVCSRCWKMEQLGNQSFRQMSNDNAEYGLATIAPERFQPAIEYSDIQYLDITLGNKCNLACRMCHPGSSSLMAKQYITLQKFVETPNIEFSRETKDKILELISRSVNLSSIYFLGGEPLVNEFHDEIIELLIKTNRAQNITLHYSTNLHVDVEQYLTSWVHFKLVKLSVSIDGCDAVYEYIRWPGSWNKVYRNLKIVSDLSKQHNNIDLNISVTIQNLNVGNIHTLIEKIRQIDQNLSFYFIPVTGCNYLQLTPVDVLKDAINNLLSLADTTGRIAELINYYTAAQTVIVSQPQINEFFKMQKDFDRLRNQNLFTVLPHFKEYANTFNIDTW
jgi:radical SAM protein with 4Fe4S-binding SPASM domain